MRPTRSSFARRTAYGCTAVVVLAGGLLVATPAFAATSQDGDFSSLAADLGNTSAGTNDIAQLGADVSGGTITVAPGMTRVLDLAGHTLNLDTLQLTTVQNGSASGSTLTIIDSTGAGSAHGSGQLIVNHTSDLSTAAIEVDSGSTLDVKQAVITATANGSGTAAGIGGGGLVDLYTSPKDVETAGTIDIGDGAVVTASGSQSGAAIGGGRFGAGGTITVEQTAQVTASVSNSDAAAIGAGSAGASGTNITIDGTGRNSRGGSGVTVTATSSGTGAAIGGGYLASGGSINVHDYSAVTATSSEAGIGDGQGATGSSQVTIDGYSTVSATGGGSGGAGIGGSNQAYGSDQVSIGGNSVVTATGTSGPGIGGERNRYATTVAISGAANVTAKGGGNGAGIGGGDSAGPTYQSGASLTLSDTADLTVGTSSPAISAIGAGSGSGNGSIGLGGGVLHLGSGQQITVPSGSTFTNSSLFMNAGSLSTAGSGVIDNEGVILNSGSISGKITGFAFAISYNPGTGSITSGGNTSVFASTMQKAQIGLATAAPSTRGTFVGWNTKSDASGTFVVPSTDLSALAQTSTGSPVVVPLYAIYQLNPVLGTGTLPRAALHSAYHGSVAVTAGTGPLGYSETGSFPAGLKLDHGTGAITGTPTAVGTYRFTVKATNRLASVTCGYTITVGKPLASTGKATVKAKHGFLLKFTNLLSAEPVHIAMTGPSKATWNGKAKKGVYTLNFKHGLVKKGKYTLTVSARTTARTLIFHLTVK